MTQGFFIEGRLWPLGISANTNNVFVEYRNRRRRDGLKSPEAKPNVIAVNFQVKFEAGQSNETLTMPEKIFRGGKPKTARINIFCLFMNILE
jgi:hypothetical protein